MENLKLKMLVIVLIFCLTSQGQSRIFDVSGVKNYLSYGVQCKYVFDNSSRFTYAAGLKANINSFDPNTYSEPNSVYSNGYVNSYKEALALSFGIDYLILNTKRFQVFVSNNYLLSYLSLKQRTKFVLYFPTQNSQEYIEQTIITKPSGSLEATIGLKLMVPMNKKVSIYLNSGVGVLIFSYDNYYSHYLGRLFDKVPVGIHELPMLEAGLRLKLW